MIFLCCRESSSRDWMAIWWWWESVFACAFASLSALATAIAFVFLLINFPPIENMFSTRNPENDLNYVIESLKDVLRCFIRMRMPASPSSNSFSFISFSRFTSHLDIFISFDSLSFCFNRRSSSKFMWFRFFFHLRIAALCDNPQEGCCVRAHSVTSRRSIRERQID